MKRILFVAVLICFSAMALQAATTGKITGVVKAADSGEPVIGANIMVVGTNLGTVTGLNGAFDIIGVPPGIHSVQVTMMGFKKVTKTELKVAIDQVARVNFNLEATVIEGEAVVTTAERDILHKEISSNQLVVSGDQMVEAAGVRTVNQFLSKQPGVMDANNLTIRGGSAEQTGSMVNGLSFVNVRIGRADATVPLSSIEQVSLLTGGFSAEYGNYRSGLINVVSKSGDRNKYSGQVTYSRNTDHMKRFGQSLYDPTNAFLRSIMDPVVSFGGTAISTDPSKITGWSKIYSDPTEAAYILQQYQTFGGWDAMRDTYNKGKAADKQVTPIDLYLYSAWMHTVVPDFAALEARGYTITDAQKQALIDHAFKKEGSDFDFNLDFGFGGPVPFLSKLLGNSTFYLSNQTTRVNFIQPVIEPAEKTGTTLLTVKSELSRQMTLTLNGIYKRINGVESTVPSNGAIPDINNGGGTMAENNIGIFYTGSNTNSSANDNYYYHPTYYNPKEQTNLVFGGKLNHVLSDKTFYELQLSYASVKDYVNPEVDRDHTTLVNFGPIWLDEMPYGRAFIPDTVRGTGGQIVAYDEFDALSGVSIISRRFAGKTGEYHENSYTKQMRARFDLSSQMNNHHYLKTGVEVNYFSIKNDLWTWWRNHDTIYELRFDRHPAQLGAYLQDQLSFEGLEAKIGLRADYYYSGGDVWPTGNPYNTAAFTAGTEWNNPDQLYTDLSSGHPVIWKRWEAVDDTSSTPFLVKTKNYFTVSPRLGLSFPVTERSKFYFNYGHFRSPVSYSSMFMYSQRFAKKGLGRIGNPNLEPPRTIQYELGLSYNLADQYLIDLSTYYKDVTGEAADIRYYGKTNGLDYFSSLNNGYQDVHGFEAKIVKEYGRFFTGWLNFWFLINKNGNTGRRYAYEEYVNNTLDNSLYLANENVPTTQPRVAANITFNVPDDFGPSVAGLHPAGGWLVSALPSWSKGGVFTWNPANIRNLTNNQDYPDYYMLDLKVSKTFKVKSMKVNFFVDVNNVLDLKVNWIDNGWCFRNATDRTNYLASLHLPMYDSPVYDALRAIEANKKAGLYQPGSDKIGDLRSSDKPYINDPDVADIWLYGYPRDIWFGVTINL
jgi:outer membrane receptor protein involved in Fe transport